MPTSKIAVLVDERDDIARRAWSWGHVAQAVYAIERDEQLLPALRACSQDPRVEVVAVQGKDHFLGGVMTTWRRHFTSGLERPLDFYPLPVDATGCEVASSLSDTARMDRRVEALLKRSAQGARGRRLERVQVETLWVSDSLDEGGRYAFNMATGWFYELWLATRQRGVSGLVQLAKMGGEVARKLSASQATIEAGPPQPQGAGVTQREGVMMRDRKEVGSLPFGLLCGSLPVTTFGVALSQAGGARQVLVREEGEALTVMARARAPLKLLKGEAGERFMALHFEGLPHYMLDDQALSMASDAMLYIRPGESIWLAR